MNDHLTSKERTPEWSPTMLLRGDMEHPKHSGRYLVGVDEDSYAEALAEIDRQRAEIERLQAALLKARDELAGLRLDAALADRPKPKLEPRDFGAESFAEDAYQPDETGNDPGVILKELWSVCRVVFYPDIGDLRGDYPIEHAPGAAKDARGLIEARLAERILQRARADEWGHGRAVCTCTTASGGEGPTAWASITTDSKCPLHGFFPTICVPQ